MDHLRLHPGHRVDEAVQEILQSLWSLIHGIADLRADRLMDMVSILTI